ncbi:hypothetical protein A3860_10160 [Niastella vici]|uniref:Uncharacterized protein n=1 Tax=Niastella vici TaxID=1703345 RepID=A0A1V9FF11_9BACT|nr:hypothetical protein [Niastella vici]OQP56930.1 hypothetical protein A3860_10160 [Niastella vici]
MNRLLLFFLICQSYTNCQSAGAPTPATPAQKTKKPVSHTPALTFDTSVKTIHVFVALCDNKYQGIVPVPASIGNGQDPNSNLYWGCDAGIRTWFKKSKEWTMVKRYKVDSIRLERLVFKHKLKKYYLVADAYDGKYIRQCTIDFLQSCAGQLKDTLHIDGIKLGIHGNGKLMAYIGHDGLMDFPLPNIFRNTDSLTRDAIILACISKKYFAPLLAATHANPLVWTTGLMCPEAYTLHDALSSYMLNEPVASIRSRAASAYAQNQRCSGKAARNLLVSGW